MLVYIVTFTIIIFLSIIIQKMQFKHKKMAFILCLLSIIILSFIAGARSLNVGRDVKVYVISAFNNCRNFDSIFQYLKYYSYQEPLYYALNYVIYNLNGNINVLLFVMQFIISTIVYLIAYDESKKGNGTFSLYIFSYLIFWYNTSFNIVRQSLAIAVLLYGFKYLLNENYKKYIIFVFVAFLFHSSSIICLCFPLIKAVSKLKNRKLYLVFLPTAFLILFVLLDPIIGLLSTIFPFFQKYYNYIEMESTNLIVKFAILKFIILLIFLFFNTGKKYLSNNQNKIFSFIIIMDFMLYLSSGFVMFGYRLSYLFLPLYIYMIPRIDKSLDGKKGQNLFRIVTIITLLVYWYYRYVSIGYDGTIPYTFYWNN